MKKSQRNRFSLWSYVILFITVFAIAAVPVEASETEEPSTAVELTEEEQRYVERKQEVVIGCQTNVCPLVFLDESTGEIKGITVDILDMVSEATGLRFRYVELPLGNISYDDLQRLQVDLVASVEQHDFNRHAIGIVMTDPYLPTEKVIVCKKGVIFDPDGDMVIAAASGSPTLPLVVQSRYPNAQVELYSSTEEALAALLAGKADAVLQNQYSLERLLARPIYDDLRVVDAATIGDYHCLGAMVQVSQDKQNIIDDDTALLLSVLNKGINNLEENKVSFFIIKETAENAYRFTLEDTAYRYRYPLAGLAVSLILIVFLLGKVYDLQKKRAEQQQMAKRAEELAAINQHMHEQQILLEDALLRAEAGNRAKSSFLFNMSHDIRTPMNAILGFTDIALKHKDDPDKIYDSLAKISESGRHLQQLISNTLDMSRIESGKVVLSEDVCDLCKAITEAEETLQTEIEKKELSVQVDTEDVRNRKVCCDILRMNQIVYHLLSNAVKFSRQGGAITVALRQEGPLREGRGTYELRVKDNGVGMSKEFCQRIFEPFEREHTSTVSRTQGTGLGMSITKSLVDLMGGTIEVISEPNQGSEFILHFTFTVQEEEQTEQSGEAETAAEQEEARSAVEFAGKRILLVEDNEINMEIALEILTTEGFLVETAENGKLAVDKIKSSEPGYFDLVLMDIQMPIMDGHQAAKEIRRLEVKALAAVPIIALTANAFEEDRREALESGMDDHVAKPIDNEILFNAIRKHLNSQHA